jgi:uncharacterized membrane protein YgcG
MMLVIFLLLVVGPVIVRKFIDIPTSLGIDLLKPQPADQNNNDTLGTSQTGTAIGGGAGGSAATGGAGGGGGGGGDGGGRGAAKPAQTSDVFADRRLI